MGVNGAVLQTTVSVVMLRILKDTLGTEPAILMHVYSIDTLSTTHSRKDRSLPVSVASTPCAATQPERSAALLANSARLSALHRLLRLKQRSVKMVAVVQHATILI